MGIAFTKSTGKATSREFEFLNVEATNKVRLFGEVRAKYDYWLRNPSGQALPFECLQFIPEQERFDSNAADPAKDWIRKLELKDNFGKFINCRWAYVMLCYNYNTGKVEIISFKKSVYDKLMKLTGQLSKRAGKQLDPTSIGDDGFDLVFTREKTGPKPFDVDYDVDPYVEVEAVSEDVAATINEVMARTSIDEVVKRPTVEEQEKALARFFAPKEEEVEEDEEDTEEGFEDLA